MFYFIIVVVIRFVMNSVHITNSPDNEYPAIELDMTNFMKYLSDEYICGKDEVSDDNVRTSPRLIDCKTEDCTDSPEISSISEFEQKEKVRNIFMFSREIFW